MQQYIGEEMFAYKTLKLANSPENNNDVVEEIWDSHVYDKLIPIKSGWTVVDIGASIGVFSVYASQKVGMNGKVIAFEPETTSYEALLDNITANGTRNIYPVKAGVWSSGGTKDIRKNNGNLGASSMLFGEGNGETVRVDTLERLLKEMGITHVDFIKIDTEGAATEILKGCSRQFLQNIDNFAIAAYHVPYENPAKLSDVLKDAGFRTKTLTRYGIIPFVYATRDASINLEYIELWQVLAVAGFGGLLLYSLGEK